MFSPSHIVLCSGICATSVLSQFLVVISGDVLRSSSTSPFVLIGSHDHHAQAEIAAAPIIVVVCHARRLEHRPQSITGISIIPSSRVPGHSSPAASAADPMCQGNARLRRVPIPGPSAVKVSVVRHNQSARRIRGVASAPRFQIPSAAGHVAAMCHPRMIEKRRRTEVRPAAMRPRRAIVSGTAGR